MQGLALHRFILRFALAALGAFAWLFLFHLLVILGDDTAHALAQVAFLYALSSLTTALITPYAARAVRYGTRRAIIFAVLFGMAAYVLLGSILEGFWGPHFSGTAIACFALALGIYRALYWIPYELEVAEEGKRSWLSAELIVALAPFLAGLFIVVVPLSAMWIFYLGAVLMLFSLMPLSDTHAVRERYSWGYRETFQELMSREYASLTTHSILEGVSGAALLVFWPLAIFLIVAYSYSVLGFIMSLTFMVAILARRPVRALLRRAGLQRSRLTIAVFALTPWLFRLGVASPLSIVLVDSYFYTTTPRRLGIDPFVFEQVSDGGTLIDEQTALKEIALNIGKALICGIGAYAALLASAPVAFFLVFILAAGASLASAMRS